MGTRFDKRDVYLKSLAGRVKGEASLESANSPDKILYVLGALTNPGKTFIVHLRYPPPLFPRPLSDSAEIYSERNNSAHGFPLGIIITSIVITTKVILVAVVS